MTISSAASEASAADSENVENTIRKFLEGRLKINVDPDLDLFSSGTVTSLFAMELVVHLEQAFGIVIVGPDLRMDHFRTIRSMNELVLRLQDTHDG